MQATHTHTHTQVRQMYMHTYWYSPSSASLSFISASRIMFPSSISSGVIFNPNEYWKFTRLPHPSLMNLYLDFLAMGAVQWSF